MREGIPAEVSPQTAAFIKRMAAIFGAPDTASSSEFKAILDERIGHYSEDVLLAAADHFIDNRKSWPKIADVIAVAKNEDALAKVDLRKAGPAPVERDPWSDAAQAQADALICSDLGRRAASEGWIGHLWDFARKHGRLPHEGLEAKRVADAARGHALRRMEVASGEVKGPVGQSLARLARLYDRHDELLAKKANGEK